MTRDNGTPADEGRKPQARRLVEQAIEAERTGDQAAADRLFGEATRVDPDAVLDVLEEADNPRPSVDAPDLPPSPWNTPAGLRWHATAAKAVHREAPTQPTTRAITLHINQQDHHMTIDVRATLLDALRDHLGFTGTKKGCALGQCGSCTLLMDGRRVNACLILAVMSDQCAITTIEGLAPPGDMHAMQAAFVAHDAFQCGYCTPGQIMSAVGLLAEGRGQDDADIREQMSGNICRCGAYQHIVDAIRDVRDQQEG